MPLCSIARSNAVDVVLRDQPLTTALARLGPSKASLSSVLWSCARATLHHPISPLHTSAGTEADPVLRSCFAAIRSNHFLLPGRVSKCGAVVGSWPPAIIVLRILLRYASTARGSVKGLQEKAGDGKGATHATSARTTSAHGTSWPGPSSSGSPTRSAPSPCCGD